MDSNILFTEAVKSYKISDINFVISKYGNNSKFLLLSYYDLKYDHNGKRQISDLIKGAITILSPTDFKWYFELLGFERWYLDLKPLNVISHDYEDYYQFAISNGNLEISEYFLTKISESKTP